MAENGQSKESPKNASDSAHDLSGEFDSQPQRLSEEGKSSDTDLSRALAEAKDSSEKFKNEYMYLRAEFENYKKQAIKERSDQRKYGAERLITDMLAVLDILETALTTDAKNLVSQDALANFRKGIELTATEFRNAFQRHGVTEVASHGQPFDPAVHEAVTSEETEEHPPGTVTQVFKKPYRLHDRVIRPGQVVVAKTPKS